MGYQFTLETIYILAENMPYEHILGPYLPVTGSAVYSQNSDSIFCKK